ncbi:uncharacterized protein CTRU02_207774 [Colletotrichum truncatum]|uniref:Uncharacterized protein n=1 Tax=Colletotrichum truncatum TaxID=5467 RepID=A0ACC3Z1S6_COLTU|nr:uncharacterized protein CTRU02_09126 [Colletotrichum truncatum]KAF6788805.1 hypothetical protein CTRU02_09126 [Colletotrichum truncatum]
MITTASSQEESHRLDTRIFKRTGRDLCEILVVFQAYCKVYSGVVQLMGGIDQTFVASALEVLGLFALVAVNKSGTETELQSMIETLRSEYTRIKSLVGIYNSNKLRECVANVYRLGIEFLQEATVYYSYSSRRRLWHVATRPPQIFLDAKISALKSAIDEVVKERDVEAHLRLSRVEIKMDASIAQSCIERSTARIEKLSLLLNLPPCNPSNQLRDFASELDDEFSHLKRMPPFENNDVTSNLLFKTWMNDTEQLKSSRLLLLHGRTKAPSSTNMAWVSQASVEVVRLLQKKDAVVAFHLCKPDNKYDDRSVRVHSVPTAALVLLYLGFQLLSLTSAGRAALGSHSTPEFECLFQNVLETAKTSRELIEDRSAGNRRATSKDCSSASMAFLEASIALISAQSQLLLSEAKPCVVYLIVDRFDTLSQYDTLLLEPLMTLVQKPGPNVVIRVLVVGERKLRDERGGLGIAEFIENNQGKSEWGEIERDQDS